MIASAPKPVLNRFLTGLTKAELARIAPAWWFWRRAAQIPPAGNWRTWLLLGGRGAGKTRAGAEWVREQVEKGGRRRIALIGPTFHDVREVMIEGPSGLRALAGARPAYEATRRRLVWPNGAEAHALSAADPESLRGPQFDAAWADEFCAWGAPEETWALLSLGLRLGDASLAVITTTPKPIAALRRLIAQAGAVVTRGATRANADNLAPGFVAAAQARWADTIYARQELEGELIDDPEGALWTRALLEAARQAPCAPPDRVVLAVDPPAGVGRDACGIIAAGSWGEAPALRAVVLLDASVSGASPLGWAQRVAAAARAVGAQRVVAEANNGGEMVRAVLAGAASDIVVKLVHARYSKRARAEPVAMLYEQGRVAHARAFSALEDEMRAFGAPGFAGSPDRVDALVWALTDLMLSAGAPRVRGL